MYAMDSTYFEADHISCDEHTNALHQVTQCVDEGSPDCQAALTLLMPVAVPVAVSVGLALALRRRRRGPVGMRVKVS